MYRSRVVFTIVALAVASAAAATIRWQTWTPSSACLLCGAPDPGGTMRAPANADNLFGAGGGAPSYARASSGTFTPGPLTAAPLGNGSAASSSSAARSGSAFHGWQPWGNGAGSTRFASSGAAGSSAPLGGLWRLMSLSRPAHHDGAPHVARNIVAREKRPRPPVTSRPGKNPAPGSHSGQPGAGEGAGASETPAVPPTAGAPSTDPFHEHEAPPPDPFQGPGGFDPGGPGGKGPSAGGSGGRMSPNPEPGTILLFGTGLLGVLGVMRQRRLL